MKQQLSNMLGINVKSEKIEKLPSLPVYLAVREIEWISGDDFQFVLIHISGDDSFRISALKKQYVKYREAFHCQAAFDFPCMTKQQRTALIREKIPFISLPEQIYLPFLGIVLSESFPKPKIIDKDKMMPATQQLFLYLLYQKKNISVSKSDVAEAMGLTRTSITRASEQLLAMDLIIEEKKGKSIQMKKKFEGREYYEKARPYLINPVQKKITVREKELKEKYLYAGESALSFCSMLNPPRKPVRAVYKGNDEIKELREVDERWETETVIQLELWKYDPFLFSETDVVDPVSLICSLMEEEDERVEMCLQECLEGLKW